MKNTSFDKSRIYSCGDLSFFEKFSDIVVETKRPCVLILSFLLPIIYCCFSKRYDGLQLIVLSERMSLQKTSKPNLKRRRCHLCGQFACGNHVCAKFVVTDTFDGANICCNCMRQATVYFPLDNKADSKAGLVNRKFGRKLKNEVVHLCCSCYSYCTAPKVDWQMAWPAVFFTLLSDTSKPEACLVAICSLLPLEIRQHWLGVINLFPICIQGVLNRPRILGTCTVDGTQRLKRFEQLIRTMRQKEMAEALDLEPYPNIRCPFGCWTFIEDPGTYQRNIS